MAFLSPCIRAWEAPEPTLFLIKGLMFEDIKTGLVTLHGQAILEGLHKA
jgi:hypothetical protein